MSDELNTEAQAEEVAEQEQVETPTEASSPEVEAEQAESQTEASSVVEEKVTEKPTRAERRVQQLIEKLKQKPKVDEGLQLTPQVDENEIDPTAVQFVDDRVTRASQQTIKQVKAELAYERAIEDHERDIETASKDIDPRIEKLAVKQYQLANYQINPFTGQEVFIPTVKFSELVKSIQADLEDITASQVANAQTSLARQAQESAIQPSGNSSQRFSIKDAKKQIWSNPSQVASELESRLGYSEE